MADRGIKQLGKNLFQVRVKQLERRTGRQRNLKRNVTGNLADARRVRSELIAGLKSTAAVRPRTRLHEFAASWLEQRTPSLKPSVSRRYAYSLGHIIPVLGDLYLDSIAPADVTNYVTFRVNKVGIKGGHSVLNELRALRTIAKDSVNEGYAPRDWCSRVKPPKVRRYTKERPNLLSAQQFDLLLTKVPRQWLGLVLFMATTGLRWGEASALHWEDVDLKAGIATVSRSNDRGRLVSTKTDMPRTVPVLPEVLALWGLKRSSGLVFTNRDGTIHKGWPLIKVLTRACKLADVPRVTSHGLRRTFNNLARQLTSAVVLKSITGHSTDAMMEHYSMVAPAEKTAVSRAVASSLGVQKVSLTVIQGGAK